jgi:hypothetical protein
LVDEGKASGGGAGMKRARVFCGLEKRLKGKEEDVRHSTQRADVSQRAHAVFVRRKK